MYRFLEATAAQYVTRAVTTVTRRTTMRELEALFEKQARLANHMEHRQKNMSIVQSVAHGILAQMF